jgi:3-oxoacyl-[acyl-carrier protein] reductase
MSAPNLSCEGRVALITGGKGGIGSVVSEALARAGAHVAITDLSVDDEPTISLKSTIQELGKRFLAIQANITKKQDMQNAIARVVDEFGTIDILVNTPALIVRNVPLVDVSEGDWDKVVDTKIKGYFLSSQAVAKVMMRQRRGSIVNFSGTLGIKISWGRTAYHIAQAGAITLTKVLAYELGQYNIRTNAVAPGFVEDTPFSEVVRKDPEFLRSSEPEVPLGRLVTREEIANLVVFLASDASSFITGQTILLDGGALL